jgi:glycosyltransferase involved in cell wall biosynthesis
MVLERTSILIISHDVVGKRMAGPGIRYYHLARVLAKSFNVVLAAPQASSGLDVQDYEVLKYRDKLDTALVTAIEQANVVLVPAIWVDNMADLLSSAYVVIDGYDPFVAESLALGRNVRDLLSPLTQAILLGDFFICASERQRDWWLGLLEANGRVNSYTFAGDASLRSLVDVVPYGLSPSVPQHSNRVIKGVWPGIDEDDKIILWGGGLWPWLDPLTAIRAIEKIWQQRQDIRLIFPGTKHPNPWMEDTHTHTEAARELAKRSGLLDKAVFFGKWVPYEDWPNVLLESDVALTLHYDTLESRLAFRSRLLDYIWAGLPTVATQGDATSDLVATYGLGAVVDFEDVDDVAGAIVQLLNQPRGQFQVKFAEARQQLAWEVVAQPLIEFCRHPRRAPDKVTLGDELGNPFYIKKQQQLIVERDRWRELVQQYQQGRFMRLMRWMHRMRRRVQGER